MALEKLDRETGAIVIVPEAREVTMEEKIDALTILVRRLLLLHPGAEFDLQGEMKVLGIQP